jgi:hypothetical protein
MGREHGQGVLMTSSRQVLYRGEWVDGFFQGSGVYHFPNGDVYKGSNLLQLEYYDLFVTGDWREGTRHGKGEYTVKSLGCSYSGDWKENKRHGKV